MAVRSAAHMEYEPAWMHEFGGGLRNALVNERVSNVANTYLRMLTRT